MWPTLRLPISHHYPHRYSLSDYRLLCRNHRGHCAHPASNFPIVMSFRFNPFWFNHGPVDGSRGHYTAARSQSLYPIENGECPCEHNLPGHIPFVVADILNITMVIHSPDFAVLVNLASSVPEIRGKSLFERKKIKEKAMHRKFNIAMESISLGLSTLSPFIRKQQSIEERS